MTVDEEDLSSFEPEDEALYAARLGAPIGQQVVLSVSRTRGSDLLAMRILEEAARRGWRFVVLDYHGGIRTLEELRALAAGDPEIDIFSERAA